jgi:hypothetical protein
VSGNAAATGATTPAYPAEETAPGNYDPPLGSGIAPEPPDRVASPVDPRYPSQGPR